MDGVLWALGGLAVGLILGAIAAALLMRARVTAAEGRAAGLDQQLDELRGSLDRLSVRFDSIEKGQERAERSIREEVEKGREAGAQQARHLREEVGGSLLKLTEANEKRLDALRGVVDLRLKELQQDNARALDLMRHTVDEKLQGTLEKRLGESFRLVSERLEQVYKGLGEMQTLASGVGDLKRVLTNVKTRGTWGEIQLGSLLEQLLASSQYDTNVATREGSQERVEFAIRLPGREDESEVVWLPIDSKFPSDVYHRLLEAHDGAEPQLVESCGRELEQAIRESAKNILQKYVNPPQTTDFAIMFLPTEGLYAEVLRRPGLVELLQRKYRISVAGPTTLAALINALQMGFRTLAIQKRSSEVWSVLGAIKTEFGKFAGILDSVKKKLQEASNKIDHAASKSRHINRKLAKVQELPPAGAQLLLGPITDDEMPEVKPLAEPQPRPVAADEP